MKKLLLLVSVLASTSAFASADWSTIITNNTDDTVLVYAYDQKCFSYGDMGSAAAPAGIRPNSSRTFVNEESNGTIGGCAREDDKFLSFTVEVSSITNIINMKLSETGKNKWETPTASITSTPTQSVTGVGQYKQDGGKVNVHINIDANGAHIASVGAQ